MSPIFCDELPGHATCLHYHHYSYPPNLFPHPEHTSSAVAVTLDRRSIFTKQVYLQNVSFLLGNELPEDKACIPAPERCHVQYNVHCVLEWICVYVCKCKNMFVCEAFHLQKIDRRESDLKKIFLQ